MRRYLSVLLLIVLAGCAVAPHTALPVEEPDWRVEEPSWRMVSTDPADYGITYDGLPDLEGWPLDKLAAYCQYQIQSFSPNPMCIQVNLN